MATVPGLTSKWVKAVQNLLAADSALSGVLVGVYDGIAPQTADSGDPAAFPYLVISDVDFIEYHDDGRSGFEVLTRIETYSRDAGRKECRDITDMLYTALHRQQDSLSVDGHSVLLIDRIASTVEDPNDADGSFEGVCDYRAIVTKNAAD